MSFGATVLLAIVIGFSGAFVQGFSGFGVGIFCMAVLSLFLEFADVDQIVFFVAAFCIWTVFYRLRRSVPWRRVPWVLLGLAVGVPIGVGLRPLIPEALGKQVLGTIIALLSIVRLAQTRNEVAHVEAPPGPVESVPGFLGGILGGWGNMSGPPLIYWAHHRLAPTGARAILAAVFAAVTFAKLVSLTAYGYWRPAALAGLCAGPAALAGAWVGDRVAHRTNPRIFARIIWLLFLALGILLVATASTGVDG